MCPEDNSVGSDSAVIMNIFARQVLFLIDIFIQDPVWLNNQGAFGKVPFFIEDHFMKISGLPSAFFPLHPQLARRVAVSVLKNGDQRGYPGLTAQFNIRLFAPVLRGQRFQTVKLESQSFPSSLRFSR